MHALITGEKSLEVLLIEDHPGDIRLILEGLHTSKIASHVSVVSDGEEAIDFLFQRGRHAGAPGPDLILINSSLPGKFGWEVLAEMDLDESLRQVPVVVMVSRDADLELFSKYRIRVNCYLAKPFKVTEFVTVIHSFEQYWLSRGGRPSIQRSLRENGRLI